MAIITFTNGVGERRDADGDAFTPDGIALTTAQSTATNHVSRYVIYNEADSTVNISFDVAATTHFVSTNDNAGNEIFIREGADQLIMAPLSAAVIGVGRAAASTTSTTGATITASTTTTSHRTVSANGESLFIQRVAEGL